MFAVIVRDSAGGSGGGDVFGALLEVELKATLELSDAVEVLLELVLVGLAELLAQPARVGDDIVDDAEAPLLTSCLGGL